MGTPQEPADTPGALDRQISQRVSQWLRAEDGRTQASLAAATGIPTTSLSHYVRGTRRWSASAVAAVSRALGVTICELYGVDEGHSRSLAAYVPPMGLRFMRRFMSEWNAMSEEEQREMAEAIGSES